MLKRDMLVTLHLRIRIITTQKLKESVSLARERARERRIFRRKFKGRRASKVRPELEEETIDTQSPPGVSWLSLSPRSARQYSRRHSSNESRTSNLSELVIPSEQKDDDDEKVFEDESDEEEDEEDVGWDSVEDHHWPTMINDPGRATPLERRWLSAMSEGKEPRIAQRFEQCVFPLDTGL